MASVVITTRNRSENLAACLEALSRQTYAAPFEKLVVGGPAPDDRTQTCASQAEAGYIVAPRPGRAAACNAGASNANGSLIAFLDCDSIPRPAWLEMLLDPFATPAVMIATGRTDGYAGRQDEPKRAGNVAPEVPVSPEPAEKAHGDVILQFERAATGVNVAFRRAFFEEFGGFDERLDQASSHGSFEKLERFFRVIAAGHTLVHAPDAIVLHP